MAHLHPYPLGRLASRILAELSTGGPVLDFPRAKHGYEFLTTTPGLMAQEVARRQTEFKLLMQQIEAIEDRYDDAAGLTDLMLLIDPAGVHGGARGADRSTDCVSEIADE